MNYHTHVFSGTQQLTLYKFVHDLLIYVIAKILRNTVMYSRSENKLFI